MAGTPTTNYNIPTYADTDAPDLSGAYNDAMGIIDTQLKANADAIESASTGSYEGAAPITVDNEERTISVATASVDADGTGSASGVVTVTGKQSAINTGVALDSKVVPNARAVADYVAAHGGTAYTAGEGIDISGSTISAKRSQGPGLDGNTINNPGVIGTVYRMNTATAKTAEIIDNPENDWATGELVFMVPSVGTLKNYVAEKMVSAGVTYTGTAPIVVDNDTHAVSLRNGWVDAEHLTPQKENTSGQIGVYRMNSPTQAAFSADYGNYQQYVFPTVSAVRDWVTNRTPDASTTVKGLVQLDTIGHIDSTTTALTGSGLKNMLATQRASATQNVTVSLLSKLYIDGVTGLVYYRA